MAGGVADSAASRIIAASRPAQRAGSRASSDAASAHSLSSVAVKSWSTGAATASDAPSACTRATPIPVPAEECPPALDPSAPVVDQRCIGLDADHVQHGAGRIEEQVTAGETPRVVEGQ
jgi:hypothetical protein